MRTIKQDGFWTWAIWALFSWEGRLDRLAYLGASLLSTIPLGIALSLLFWLYLGGMFGFTTISQMTSEELLLLAATDETSYFDYLAFPLSYVNIVLSAKRLRSIGFSPLFAPLLQVLFYFSPTEGSFAFQMQVLMVIYIGILLFWPPAAQEQPSAGQGSSFQATEAKKDVVSSDQPAKRRAPKIRDWRVIAPAPRRD